MNVLYRIICINVCIWLGVLTVIPDPMGYIAGSNQVVPVDIATNTAQPFIATAASVTGGMTTIALTPDGSTLYVANSFGTNITAIDVATQATTLIPVGSSTFGIAITPDGAYAYIIVLFGDLIKLNLATQTVEQTFVGLGGVDLVMSPDGTKLYIAVISPSQVNVFDLTTDTLETTIPLSGAAKGIAITPDGSKAYVTLLNDEVAVLDLTTNTETAVVTIPGGFTYDVAVTPDGKTAYVTDQNNMTLVPITVANNTAGTPLYIGPRTPYNVGISPDGATAYVSFFDNSAVLPITLATGSLGADIPVGGPSTIVFEPIANSTAYVLPNVFLNRTDYVITLSSDPFTLSDVIRYELYANDVLIAKTIVINPIRFVVSGLDTTATLQVKAISKDGTSATVTITLVAV